MIGIKFDFSGNYIYTELLNNSDSIPEICNQIAKCFENIETSEQATSKCMEIISRGFYNGRGKSKTFLKVISKREFIKANISIMFYKLEYLSKFEFMIIAYDKDGRDIYKCKSKNII